MQYSIIDYRHHAVCYIPMTYLFILQLEVSTFIFI